MFDNRETEDITFSTLVERVIQQLEGAFALVFKSIHYPGEAVATRRGSPLLIGVRSKYKLSTEQIPVLYRTRNIENVKNICKTRMKRLDSLTCLHAVGDNAVEFFFASAQRKMRLKNKNHSWKLICLLIKLAKLL